MSAECTHAGCGPICEYGLPCEDCGAAAYESCKRGCPDVATDER